MIPRGGGAIGLFAIGGLALGVWSFGGTAIGWQAFGGFALAWDAAFGGVALVHDFALGAMAQAAQANDEIATQFFQTASFFKTAVAVSRYIGWLNLLWIVPLIAWWRALKQHASFIAD